ncbi:MAG: hypothetical protein ACW98D_02455 [Promethearchaeota archaeon]|jgi:hypothetical protein
MSYDLTFYFNIACSIGGIVFFVYSMILIRKIKKLFPGSSVTKKWLLRQFLIVIFLFGYGFNIVFLIMDLTEIITIMTAMVYIFGGLFVFIIIKLVYNTYKTILLEYAEKK